MKHIKTLIPDIEGLVGGKHGWLDATSAASLSNEISSRLLLQYGVRTGTDHGGNTSEAAEHVNPKHQEKASLRLSQMGPRCPRALWHSIHSPELAESLPPWAQVKFSFGHIIEGLAIALAKAADHEVVGEQDAVVVDGIVGHRDCIIDGCLVDVKSSNSRGFKQWQAGTKEDSFGYLDQLDGYLVGSSQDPLLRVKDRAYLLFVDKELGHMHLHEHRLREQSIRDRVSLYKDVIARDEPPPCTCRTEPDGSSGNIKLAFPATYNNFKYACFPDLRTFIYGKGPVYLTHVARKPDVMEVDRHGNPLS